MKTQAEVLYRHLRRRWMTYGDMLALQVSVCPWKRVSEGLHHLRDGEKLAKKTTHRGLVAYRVVKG